MNDGKVQQALKKFKSGGYCETKCFVAVDVDTLVVVSRREDHE